MELDLSRLRWSTLALLALVLLIALTGLGAAVTPAGAEPVVLTAQRWTALRLARRAQSETEALLRDARALHDLLAAAHPDPVAGMLLAQRLYAGHRQGVSATAAARQALIAAAETAARASVGALPRQAALDAYRAALARIDALAPPQTTAHALFIPLVKR